VLSSSVLRVISIFWVVYHMRPPCDSMMLGVNQQ
jgi:hypothetical protein